jgi:hypothetical protein
MPNFSVSLESDVENDPEIVTPEDAVRDAPTLYDN